jgi:ribosomal protein S18 acetylase RimI-like enzyme
MTVPSAAAVAPRADVSPAALRTAIHDDLVLSAIRRRTAPGEEVIRASGLVAYRSDVHSPELNQVVGTQFPPGAAADAGIDAAIALFHPRPFLWWVDENDTPADLSDRLERRGLALYGEVPGMAMDLAALGGAGPADIAATGLEILPVTDEALMAAFHRVLVQGFPEDFSEDGVVEALAAATVRVAAETRYREPNGLATRWVGFVDGRPVTTTRLHTAAGVAGIYAVVTAVEARRRGYGEGITRHVLHAARDAGMRVATLQSSPEGRGVYERIGFRVHRRYRLHEWRPAATEDDPSTTDPEES